MLQNRKMDETAKGRLTDQFKKEAGAAYAQIITRYPLQDHADVAKERLEALGIPGPRPTKAAVAQNKKEIESREESGMMSSMMGTFRKHPDVAQGTRVGEPTLVDPKQTSAIDVVQAATKTLSGNSVGGNNAVSVEVKGCSAEATHPALRRFRSASQATTTDQPSAAAELTPNVAQPRINELKPTADPATTLPPPQQVNELANGGSAPAPASASASTRASDQELASPEEVSSSKKKKKTGIRKVVPF